ncbi:hypothetical protein FB446DRAFT_709152 [Lentinula raphanica]|nr:hypothetical protein FB446DRAFT_709152 [Lentinula raphanica]
MSDERKTYGLVLQTGDVERQKFNISLAEYLRRGLNPRDYATYKPKNLVPPSTSVASATGDPETELTPQQKARKEYEDRNKEARREKARERMAKRRASDPKGERDRQTRYEERYRRTHREERRYVDISKSGDLALSPVIVNVEMDVFSVPKTTLLRPEDYSS